MRIALTLILAVSAWGQPQTAALLAQKIAGGGGSAVTYDTSAVNSCTGSCGSGSTTLTATPTIGANSNRQIFVVAWAGCRSGQTAPVLSGITANGGTALTQIRHQSSNAAHWIDIWQLSNGTQPNTGANGVSATLASQLNTACDFAASWGLAVLSLYNVNQTTALRTSNGNGGTGTSSTVTLTGTGSNELTLFATCAGDVLSSPTGTSRQTAADANGNTCGQFVITTAPAGTTSFSATIAASDSFDAVAAAVQP